MNIICKVIGHRRSARKAVRKAHRWHSVCIVCGAALVRLAPGDWVPEKAAEPRAAGPETGSGGDLLEL